MDHRRNQLYHYRNSSNNHRMLIVNSRINPSSGRPHHNFHHHYHHHVAHPLSRMRNHNHHPVAHPLSRMRNHNRNINNYSRSRHSSPTYQANVETINPWPHVVIYPEDEVAILESSVVVDGHPMHMDMAIRDELELVQETGRYLPTAPPLSRVRNHNSQLPETLDIDNMSYEELLLLSEHFPGVETGLSEENINLLTQTHIFAESQLSSSSNGTNDFCVICQENYIKYDRIGSLDCSHAYHFDCLKSWLKINNICPICKSPGLTKVEEMQIE
ncbi:probable E3 ubiquitin-protein ligase HIP1 [Impatiens glandulifera]|uniref:probable E3 ubiquitin-protein ligase HIP1 n=1 Tax=Impatiens glandulifera TaxID=253017 RepID=UPI001FB0D5E4|nr:probable E3 ubiquitin-protein ligase HIP1 [Impatiens glandulifera]